MRLGVSGSALDRYAEGDASLLRAFLIEAGLRRAE